MAIREIQDGEDKVVQAFDRTYQGAITESMRHNGATGKVAMPAGHSSDSPQYEAWDKAAADGAAANATAEHMIFRARQACTVRSVHYLPDAALTADNGNYATITVQKRAAGGGSPVTVASKTTQITGSGNWTQWVAVALALSTTAANIKLAAGETLTVAITKTGTGVVVPAGQLIVSYSLT
jgi:hypothetical protein